MIDEVISAIQKSDDLLVQFNVDLDPYEVTSRLNDLEYHAIVIDRAPVFDRDTLMHALYQNLRFPAYFGFNWDALKDVLTGIDGVRKNGFVFTFSDFNQMDEDIRSTFLEVVEEANEVRANHDELAKLRVLALK